MVIYTLHTAVVSSIWSIVTSLVCWLLGATLPLSPYRIRVSHSYGYVLPSVRVFITTILCTCFEDILSQVDYRQFHQPSKRSNPAPNESPLPDSTTTSRDVTALSKFRTFCTGGFVFVYSTIVTVASSLFVFIFGFFGNFGFKAFFDRLRCFLVYTAQIYTTLKKAVNFLNGFLLRDDPSFLRFLYFVLKIVYSPSQALERFFDGRSFKKCNRRYLKENSKRTIGELTTSNRHLIIPCPCKQGPTIPWNASTISTIFFDSIQSTTTISFSISLLNSASILLPQYFRINLSSSRRRDAAILKQTIPEEPSPAPGSFDELSSSGRLPRGRRTIRTILRDSDHPETLNTTFRELALENKVEESTSIPSLATPVPPETPELDSLPNAHRVSAGSHHNNNDDDLSECVEVATTSSFSRAPTLFPSSSSDFSDPFTLYSFISPPPPSNPSSPHPSQTLCRKEHTLVNDRSEFLCFSPPSPPSSSSPANPLAGFHSNDEFMKIIKLEGHSPIGQGSFGTVWKATGGGDGGEGREKQYAVKIVKRVRGLDKVLANEIAAMWNVSKSRWAVQLDYWQASEDKVLLAMRYCMGGSLMKLWESFGCRMDSKLAVFYAAELILAIHDLHTRGIMHRDIKLDNIMLDNGHIRIADFGLALSFDHGAVSKAIYPIFCHLGEMGGDVFPPLFAAPHNPHIARGACGTPGYGPPEVWNEESYSFGVDYFAMGCTLHAMLTGDLPYHWVEKDDDYDLKELRIDPRGFLTEVERDFLTKALAYRPSHRLSVRRMKQHPMFTHIDWNALAQGQVEPPTP